MKTKKYEINTQDNRLIVGYKNGILWTILLDDSFDEVKANRTFTFVTSKMLVFSDMLNVATTYKWQVIELDSEVPTFEDFWEKYSYKVGRKEARDKWDKLKDKSKVEAYCFIDTYNKELLQTGLGKKYPKTYLHNKIWEE